MIVGDRRHPPLVLLHGFLGRGEGWSALAEALQNEYFCLLPDLPGHGGNRDFSLDAPLDFDSVAAWLARTLDDFRLPQVHLVGYSLGGRVALHFAVHYPQRIRSLTLESANAGIVDEAERARRLAEDFARAEALLEQGMAAFVEGWYEMPLFASLRERPRTLARIKAAASANDPAWMAKVIRELSPGAQAPLWDSLAGLSFPVLLIGGAKDEKYIPILRKMAQAIPSAQIKIVPGAGHNVHAEEPQRYLSLLREFLRVQSAPRATNGSHLAAHLW
jgi:2-succinyl-6-hydroxy-2,4-cyclohexadiene-1-carboxylate synthase